jgi:hypothetical protein
MRLFLPFASWWVAPRSVVLTFTLQMKEIKAVTEAHGRQCEREARAILEAARQKRLEEDRDQKSQIDDLYLRTRAAASTIKERAEAEFRVQETLRAQYMAETESMLARSREELEAVVRKSEDIVHRAETRLQEMRADAHSEELRKSEIQADMHAIVKEAHSASCAAWAELNNIKGGVHSQCRQPVDDVLRVLASAQAVVSEIEAEQKALIRSQSRGLELNAKSAMRYAVQAKQQRKHLFKWALATNRCVQSAHAGAVSQRHASRTCPNVLLIFCACHTHGRPYVLDQATCAILQWLALAPGCACICSILTLD